MVLPRRASHLEQMVYADAHFFDKKLYYRTRKDGRYYGALSCACNFSAEKHRRQDDCRDNTAHVKGNFCVAEVFAAFVGCCFGKTSMGLKSIRHFEQQFFRLFPAEARVGYGFAVNSLLCFAGAVLNVALYHKTLYELFNVRGHFAAVEDFF